MILYHGTNTIITDIDLSLSKPYKDFGKAFYLSDDISQAKEIAISSEFEYLIEGIIKDMTIILMEEYNIDMLKALDMIYTSTTFKKLKDSSTGLYFQSSRYVLELLKEEVKKIENWKLADSYQRSVSVSESESESVDCWPKK